MNKEDAKKAVMEVIADQLGIARESALDDETTLTKLGADSLDHVELIMGVEDVLEIEIDEHEAPFDKGTDITVGEFVGACLRVAGKE